jgi:hypothetical protein
MPIGVISTTMKLPECIVSVNAGQDHPLKDLQIQFVAVPSAAPLFFIDNELISAHAVSFGCCQLPCCTYQLGIAMELPIVGWLVIVQT